MDYEAEIEDLQDETTEVSDELAETKRKLEIAVKGLKDILGLSEIVVSFQGQGLTIYRIAVSCLKDLGVE